VSPKAATSNKATYILGCSNGPVTVSATAAVTPTSRKVSCGAAPPSATFTGTIHDAKAGTVTYYWELPTGNGPTRSLTFSTPGTEQAVPATVTAASDTSTASGTLVVLSPAAASSNTATFSVSCTQPGPGSSSAPTGSSTPGTTPTLAHPPNLTVDLITNQIQPKTVLCGSTPPAFQVTATITSDEVITGETFHWVWPDGTTTAPSKMNVQSPPGGTTNEFDGGTNATFKPASDTFSGNATLVFTSPAQGSWSLPLALTCSTTASASPSPTRFELMLVLPPDERGGELPGRVGQPFSETLNGTGGAGPFTWTITGLPPGLTMDTATGTISGTPTTEGSYNAPFTLTDSESPPQSLSGRISFIIAFPPIKMAAPPPLPDGTVGAAYPSVTFSATGGEDSYQWFVYNAFPLPAGLSLSESGVLSGTPTVAGTFTVEVGVDDLAGDLDWTTLTLVINPA
jgi:hypothetical protein